MQSALRVVRHADLKPTWSVLRAKEPGFMRSLITWMGGPEGYINTNPGVAIESHHSAVGLMDMGPGQRQPGVHTHSMVEIYVIIEGTVESFDGVGNRHIAGPLDCLYIPKGVPHGVRTVGAQTVRLLWVNDEIERWGVSLYQEEPGSYPAANGQEVSLISFRDLEPDGSAPRTIGDGCTRRSIYWVADDATGTYRNATRSARNDRVSIGLTVVPSADRLRDDAVPYNRLFVVARGRAILDEAREARALGPLDALFCPAGKTMNLRALEGDPLHLVHVHEHVR